MNESEKELEIAEPTSTNVEEPKENTEEEVEFTDSSNSDSKENIEEVENQTTSSESVVEESEKEEKKEKKVQTKEERSKFAEKRRKQEESIYQEAYKKGKLEAYKGKMNPFTQTIINDEKDVEVLENMYKLSEAGKDPVADYYLYVADKQREEEKEKEKREEIEKRAKKDVEGFMDKYPNINLTELLENETFKDYSEGKNKSLTEIYENYLKLKNFFRTEAINQASQTISNAISTPGSLSNQTQHTVDYNSMSTEEFLKEVEKVKNGY